MESTVNYEIFKKHKGNREIVNMNLNKIIKSIQSKNLLEFRPILVNKAMEVIDGQHRLEAAKVLKIPIYYVINKECEAEDIYLLNDNQKAWRMDDWVNFYCSKGVEDYIKMKEFAKKNDLHIREAYTFLTPSSMSKSRTLLKQGKLKFPEDSQLFDIKERLQKINEIKNLVSNKTFGNKIYLHSTAFNMAMSDFLSIKNVDFDIFMKKINLRMDLFCTKTKYISYMIMFKKIYNFKNQDPISLNEEEIYVES